MDLEMAPPFKRSNPWKLNLLSKPLRLEGTKAARRSRDRWVAFGLLMWVHWGKGTMAKVSIPNTGQSLEDHLLV